MSIQDFLEIVIRKEASDLHLVVGSPPVIRVDGQLLPVSAGLITPQDSENLIFELLSSEQKEMLLVNKEIDFSFALGEIARFRVNAYFQKGYLSAALRLIPHGIKTIEELRLPLILHDFARLSQGFVLVVGPNGHGKSTTLAAIIDIINKERAEKIVTIEDPIEYLFSPDKSIIDQREVYQDTFSFHRALRSTFRQNANVIMVGEVRDYETMSAVVTAAETGHLVMTSLHTNSASQTIERIIDSFPPNQELQIRNQLANTISGIISQRLIPRIKGGLIPAVEVMIATPAIRTLIRDNRPRQMDMVIETSQDIGMISMERSLADLVRRKEISWERAEFYSQNPKELKNLI